MLWEAKGLAHRHVAKLSLPPVAFLTMRFPETGPLSPLGPFSSMPSALQANLSALTAWPSSSGQLPVPQPLPPPPQTAICLSSHPPPVAQPPYSAGSGGAREQLVTTFLVISPQRPGLELLEAPRTVSVGWAGQPWTCQEAADEAWSLSPWQPHPFISVTADPSPAGGLLRPLLGRSNPLHH